MMLCDAKNIGMSSTHQIDTASRISRGSRNSDRPERTAAADHTLDRGTSLRAILDRSTSLRAILDRVSDRSALDRNSERATLGGNSGRPTLKNNPERPPPDHVVSERGAEAAGTL